ncbi:DUF721 domain-containing protein [Sulfobacillus harzensis]|uniref:DUF721 domain-containing protein n=1 Tax=Sulfobacillus harzensis TaxID=2729629 RepID=A0A7Y0Q0D9_9FIRM|nr:DUF721 domain-containing protein [Sulfobacillus harzensis]NMP20913.1 DUF721 domain-containing protein [Sulfobacillus harzensis]
MESTPDPRLGEILSRLSAQHGWQRAEWLRALDRLWRHVVGDTVAEYSHILTLTNDGVLVVAVPSSVWAQEIGYYKPRILAAIADELPQASIKDIRTRVKSDFARLPRRSEPYRPSPHARTEHRLDPHVDLQVLLARVQENYQEAAHEWLANGFVPCARCHAPTLKGYRLCVACELDRQTNA